MKTQLPAQVAYSSSRQLWETYTDGKDRHKRSSDDQTSFLSDKQKSVSSDREKLAEKFLASWGSRTKRSTLPPAPLSTRQLNIDVAEFLDGYDSLIGLPLIERQKPVCSRAANDGPNPSAPRGYANWEAFLVSEGQGNSSIKNPREEVRNMLSTAAVNFVMREEFAVRESYRNDFSDFQTKLNSAANRENAISCFAEFNQKVDNAYVALLFKRKLLLTAIKKEMADTLRTVQFGTPNRWIEGQCWNFTSDRALWNQRWQEQYLPQALRAISSESNSDLEYVFSNRRHEYLNNGINALRSRITAQGWQPYSISGAEDLPSPVVPPVRQDTTNTSQR